jgi:hypothetical protein
MTPPLEERLVKDMEKAIDEMSYVHIGGIFNGNNPVTFEWEDKYIDAWRPKLKEEILPWLHTAFSQIRADERNTIDIFIRDNNLITNKESYRKYREFMSHLSEQDKTK